MRTPVDPMYSYKVHDSNMLNSIPQTIWLISGWAGAGKDTTADLLANLLDNVQRDSFAAAVKDEVAGMYNLDRAYLDTHQGKDCVLQLEDGALKTVRDLLIEHAQNTKEATHNTVWAERLKDPAADHWVISDWRFIDELLCLRMRFPHAAIYTIRVRRPSVESKDMPTEHELDDFVCQYTIENTGSLLNIGNQLMGILHSLHMH